MIRSIILKTRLPIPEEPAKTANLKISVKASFLKDILSASTDLIKNNAIIAAKNEVPADTITIQETTPVSCPPSHKMKPIPHIPANSLVRDTAVENPYF